MRKLNRPKIGLALGSGGSKGLAHIGVIKVLEENNIAIDFIAGASMGAMIGGCYASGLSIEKIEEVALDITWRQLLSLVDPNLKQGLLIGEKVKAFIESHLDGKHFENCRIPFSAVATDLETGESVVLTKGGMAEAIRASISVPLVFKPIEIDGRTLADGGLSAPVPVDIVRNMGANIVIAVNLGKHYYDQKLEHGWYDIANESLNIMCHHLSFYNTKEADIVIEIDLRKDSWYKFVNGQDKIMIGEQAAKRILPQLKEAILQRSKDGSNQTVWE
jgi:NTE family protein